MQNRVHHSALESSQVAKGEKGEAKKRKMGAIDRKGTEGKDGAVRHCDPREKESQNRPGRRKDRDRDEKMVTTKKGEEKDGGRATGQSPRARIYITERLTQARTTEDTINLDTGRIKSRIYSPDTERDGPVLSRCCPVCRCRTVWVGSSVMATSRSIFSLGIE
ncbi:hypothetical protein WN55_01921 [Dufourea novaeangliae]|uniref:Uncharacterized protein n=1 Tax=Dufourea novaeangliae TaxID=178035 RepID=A0A154PFA7_DUFNO|nr:hypothetical protein WN55_01921 [Dufourea novaeangliae]